MNRHRTHRAGGADRAGGVRPPLTAAPEPEPLAAVPVRMPAPPIRRSATLPVGAVDDPHEAAADRAADAALTRIRRDGGARPSAPSSSSSGSPAGPVLVGREGGQTDEQTHQAITSMRGRGAPLPDPVRARMESAFDTDLSAVRIHTDKKAAGLSHSLSAKAFTVGSDMFFGSGQFRPDTADGEHTLAHEIAHTVQQGPAVHRIRRAFDLRAKQPLGVDTTTEMTTVGDRPVWFLSDGDQKVVVKLEDQPLGLNQLATHLHARLSPTSVVTTKKLIATDRTAVRQLIHEHRVTAGNGWSKASSGDFRKADFDDDNAYGRAVHLAKIDSSADPMIAMSLAEGRRATDLADPSLSFEGDDVAPFKKVLTDPKMVRQLGELTATDLFVGNGDRVLSGNLGNWFYTPEREMTVIDNVDAKMTSHLNAVGARTGANGAEVNEGDRDPLWRLAKAQLPTTAKALLDAVSASVSGTYMKTITTKSGANYEVNDGAKKQAWDKWLKPLRAGIEAELVAGMIAGRKRIIKTMTSTRFSNSGKRGAKKEIKQQARLAQHKDSKAKGGTGAPDYYDILKARASWLSSH